MKTFLSILILTLCSISLNAQDGTLDTTFGNGGKINYTQLSVFVDMKIDHNNKIVALGRNASGIPILVRFNENGALDTTFDTDGIKEIDFGFANDTPTSFAVIDNGAETGYVVLCSLGGKMAKITDSGALSSTFGTGGILEYEVFDAYRNSSVFYDATNSKINIVRADAGFSEATGGKIYRRNYNGTADTTFNSGNGKTFYFYNGQLALINKIGVDNSGNIYIHGNNIQSGNNQSFTVKFSAAAQDFSYAVQVNNSSSSVKPGYFFNTANYSSFIFGMNSNYKMMVAKKLPNGNLDSGFGVSGILSLDYPAMYYDNVTAITKMPSGQMILAGRVRQTTGNSEIFLTRISTNGNLDTTFGSSGFTSVATTIANHTGYVATEINYATGKLYTMGLTATGVVSLMRHNLNSAVLSTAETVKKEAKIHPNPAKEQLHFTEPLKEINIFDLNGKKVKNFTATLENITISDLAVGIYIIKAIAKDGKAVNIKFVKE